jgi:hypothetical protein
LLLDRSIPIDIQIFANRNFRLAIDHKPLYQPPPFLHSIMNLTASTLDFSAPSSPLKAAPRQLVFIDRNVPDYHVLAAGVLPELATILVNLDTDGIDQITRVLDCHKT